MGKGTGQQSSRSFKKVIRNAERSNATTTEQFSSAMGASQWKRGKFPLGLTSTITSNQK